jgi:acetyl esterase/lipase
MRRLAAPLLLALASCSPLHTFNALVPKDGAAALVAKDQAFASGPRRKLDLYAPKRRSADARLPVIVFFYGGSWSSGDKKGYGFAGRALAAQGFLVAIPDYRLVPEVRFPGFIEDGAAAVRWVRANAARFGGDPDRIVLAGHSAGAYNAAMLSFDPAGWARIAAPSGDLPDSRGRTTSCRSTARSRARRSDRRRTSPRPSRSTSPAPETRRPCCWSPVRTVSSDRGTAKRFRQR